MRHLSKCGPAALTFTLASLVLVVVLATTFGYRV